MTYNTSQESKWIHTKCQGRCCQPRLHGNAWAEPISSTPSQLLPEPIEQVGDFRYVHTAAHQQIGQSSPVRNIRNSSSKGMDREFALVDKNRIMSVQAKNPPPSVQPHRSTETPNEDIIENGDAYSEQSLVMASRYDSLFNFLNRTTSVSANYQGNPYSLANQSANIPDDLNTSIWITNLPPSLTHAMLLKSVRDCGKVYATVINAPGNDHVTSASKIVFFDAVGAKNLMRQAHDGKFVVGGYMPKVRHNRIKSEPKAPSPCSRVLHIEGPSSIVNQPFLQAVFKSRGITWQDEEVLVLYINEIVTRLEWRFGSYRCQAEFARNAIEKAKKGWDLTNEVEYEQSQLWKNVTVHFGIDPCAPKEVTEEIPGSQDLPSPCI